MVQQPAVGSEASQAKLGISQNKTQHRISLSFLLPSNQPVIILPVLPVSFRMLASYQDKVTANTFLKPSVALLI